MPSVQEVTLFLDALKPRQIPWVSYPAILGFLATTGAQDTCPAVGVARLSGLSPGDAPNEARVRLRGALPRRLRPRENVTVSVSRYDRFAGFQIKSQALLSVDARADCFEELADGILVHGRRTYTTHHSPYELQFFERVPFDEVHAIVGSVDHGVVALGIDANISPRLLFHHEESNGVLTTYHGDGVAMKTFRNLQRNARAVMLTFDLASLQGYALVGSCEEVPRNENRRATERIDQGFQVLGFGRPNRIFRHRCEIIERVSAGELSKSAANAWFPGRNGAAKVS
jgi:hypothetical protein